NPGSAVSIPISSRSFTTRGVSPSPQTFSLGNEVFSTSATSTPWRARKYAAVEPPGPAPITRTSTESAAAALCATPVLSPRRLGPRQLVKSFTSSDGDARPGPVAWANRDSFPRDASAGGDPEHVGQGPECSGRLRSQDRRVER